jgi:hypothetical protein
MKLEEMKITNSEEAIHLLRTALAMGTIEYWARFEAVYRDLRKQVIRKNTGGKVDYEFTSKSQLFFDFFSSWEWYNNLPVDTNDFLDVIERSREVVQELLDSDVEKLTELKTYPAFFQFAHERYQTLLKTEKYQKVLNSFDINGG